MDVSRPVPPRKVPSSAREVATGPRLLASGDLFGSAREVRIQHHGVEYRLMQTRQGKLILTK